jgi:hypothetical protein
MMRTMLLPVQDHGSFFDEMRNQFNYRYEFAYTKIIDTVTPAADRELLKKFGLIC